MDESNDRIHIWFGNRTARITKYLDMYKPVSIFVTIDGSIYVNSYMAHQVKKWILEVTEGIAVENFDYGCYGLFIDIANYLYCCNI